MASLRQQWKSLLALSSLMIILGIASPHFFTTDNVFNILQQSAINAILGIGITFVIISAGIDLSIGSVLALCGLVFANLLVHGHSLAFASVGCIGLGIACGTVNGIVTVTTRIPPFIATLGMMMVARSVATVFSGSRPISGLPAKATQLASTWHGIPLFVIWVIALYFIAHIILTRTKLGRYTYAIGSNERAAWLSGIATGRYTIIIYAISGAMAGIAGLLMTSRLNAASPLAGEMYELYAIAAAVVGGVSLIGGEGYIVGTLIGALLMGILRNGLNLLGVPAAFEGIVIGSVVVLAVIIDKQRHQSHTLSWRISSKIKSMITACMFFGCLVFAWMHRQTNTTDHHKTTIAFIPKTRNSAFWATMEEGARKAAQAYGAELIVLAPDRETDVERQMQIVENMILRKVDGIILAPSGAKELVPALRKANDSNIPVLAVDSRFDEHTIQSMNAHTVGFVGSDNTEGGRLAGEGLAKQLNQQGDVALLEGIPGHETSNNRKQGFLEAIARYPRMRVVATLTAQSERQLGFSVTQNMLQAHPKLSGIFATNDEMAFGAFEAVSSARKNIPIIGFDATDAARESIAQGKLYGSVAQFPDDMGYTSVRVMIDLLKHQKQPAPITDTRVELVTQP